MTNQDYEQKKRECWEEFCKEHPLDTTANGGVAFRYAFDRAYALGKQFGYSEQVIEEAAEKHADEMSVPSNIPGALVPLLHDIAKSSYLQGAQDFIGKQEKNAEGEEILTLSREKLKEAFDTAKKIATSKMSSKMLSGAADMVCKTLNTLFGSKCLPDEVSEVKRTLSENLSEPKPAEPEEVAVGENTTTTQKKAEPKYRVGQIVYVNGVKFPFKIQTVSTKDGASDFYTILGLPGLFSEYELSPAPKIVDDGNIENLRQNPAGPKDDIRDILMYTETENRWQEPYKIDGGRQPVADRKGSGDDRRLNIAVQIMSGIMSNQKMLNNLASGESTVAGVTGCIVDAALMYTDALLAKLEKKTI